MGAWIEINTKAGRCDPAVVAPYMGAWIEIRSQNRLYSNFDVAPYMGAWIEIPMPWLNACN